MELILSDDDARMLLDFLRDHLREVEFEVARTDAKDLRHVLLGRQELVKRLVAELERKVRT